MVTAVVHDWLTGMRGGEKVLEAILELYPDADLFTLLHNPGSVSAFIENRKIFTSFVNRLPFKRDKYRHYLPLFPTAIELFDIKPYDLIISTSHCVAKGVRTPPNTLHIAYMHSPMRYVWDMYEDYFAADKLGFFSRKLIPLIANYLRIWDVTSSNRVDHFIANSDHVAHRIKKYYNRNAEIIHPPVDTDKFAEVSVFQGEFYLVVSALVPYKRVDLAVHAFNELEQRLLIVGSGPEAVKLKKMAKTNIEFRDWVPWQELVTYYGKCRALIFPGEEDFGIVPVEAQACGKPVIAFARGGALETVIGFDGKNIGRSTGIFFAKQDTTSLREAVLQCEKQVWNGNFIRNHAQQFSKSRFKKAMMNFINQKIGEFF